MDASMNTVQVITTGGDTLSLSTMDADPTKVQGVLIADSVKVTYMNQDVDGTKVPTVMEMTVTAHSPYYYIAGSWVEPNPINAEEVQGFKLNPDGTAASINMATLEMQRWSLLDNLKQLSLQSRSVGNKVVFEMTDTLDVVTLNADSLVLSQNGAVVWSLARQTK